jgi:chemotaxis protein methyltransferase CheR
MIEDENIELLINDVFELYGYDFTDYSRASLRRRISRLYTLDKFPSFAELRYRVKNDPAYLKRFVEEITVNVTEMFRDPQFYQVLRTEILPKLGTHPYIRIWHAGCSTGEEVYSMAILLKEANLLSKSIIYATDLNPDVLEKARTGIFPISNMKQYSENYMTAGGREDFSSYYSANYDGVKFDEALSKQMVFSAHNLVSDSSFNEFHLIVCRNVLIYFDKQLQDRVFELFDKSLGTFSYLALGSKETIKFSTVQANYKQVGKEKIWKKVN